MNSRSVGHQCHQCRRVARHLFTNSASAHRIAFAHRVQAEVLPFPVSLRARRKKAVPSICAERRPGPARAPSRCHGHCPGPATRMWTRTPRARPAGAAAPGPVTVSNSSRLRLRPRFLQVQVQVTVIEILFNRDRHSESLPA